MIAFSRIHMQYTHIILPTRAQPDTIVAIFILKTFGKEKFPGVENTTVECLQVLPPGISDESMDKEGKILIDIGAGRFDHHGKSEKTTASALIARYLGVDKDPALAKLLQYAERDDFFGKGTMSNDPLDRAFGLSALIANLNRSHVKDHARVVDVVLPLLVAHYEEEARRAHAMPKEFEEKLNSGDAETFAVRQHDKNLKAVMLTSESSSMAGFLRSQNGGRYDVVVQWLPSGHVNILTRPTKKVDLRQLAALIRYVEAETQGKVLPDDAAKLSVPGRLPDVPEWYYDPATNSIMNGGLNPKEVPATKIPRADMRQIVTNGLTGQL